MKKKDKAGKKPKQVARPPFKKPRVKKQVEPKIPDLKPPTESVEVSKDEPRTVMVTLPDNVKTETELARLLNVAAIELEKVAKDKQVLAERTKMYNDIRYGLYEPFESITKRSREEISFRNRNGHFADNNAAQIISERLGDELADLAAAVGVDDTHDGYCFSTITPDTQKVAHMKRAYEVALKLQQQGLITNTPEALDRQVDEMIKFDGRALESFERAVQAYGDVDLDEVMKTADMLDEKLRNGNYEEFGPNYKTKPSWWRKLIGWVKSK